MATVPDHQIFDLTSFDAVTCEPHQVAGLYFYYKLDCLIDLAYAVSHDFFRRPELFTDLPSGSGESIAPLIAKLHARYGTDEFLLNKMQRAAVYAALFGKIVSEDFTGDEEGNFPNLRDELIEACATFVETKFGDEVSLRENVRQKHRLFKEYLSGLLGASVRWSREEALATLTEVISYPILRNQGVSAVYGIARPAIGEWPYTFDSNAAKLVEEISKQLMGLGKPPEFQADKMARMPMHISREEITNLQRAAIEGAQAIATAIDVVSSSTEDEVDLLIRKCYTWGTALKSLGDHPRIYSTPGLSRANGKTRGGIAVAQPLFSPVGERSQP
jgi:hypothetical protein